MHAAALPALALLAGTAAGAWWPLHWSPALLLILGASACGTVWAAWSGSAAWLSTTVATAFATGGVLMAADTWQEARRPSLLAVFDAAAGGGERVAAQITGVLREDALPRPDGGVALSLAATTVNGQPAEGGLRLVVGGELAYGAMHAWRAGRTVTMPAEIRRPARYFNPGAFDEEQNLARRGVVLVGSVKSGALVDVVRHGSAAGEAAASARAFVRAAIGAEVGRASVRSAGIVTAIVIGDRSGLDEETRRRLQEAGTYHVIAISGGNIAILAALVFGAFRLVGVPGRAAIVAAIAALAAYAFIVGGGGGASVQRATLMAIAHLLGRAIDLRGPPGNSLAVAVAILVATQPLTTMDPAFLLTCGATAGILVVVPAAQRVACPRWLRPILMLLAASAAAEIALMPVGAYFFSQITVAGLLLNFAAIPLMAVAQIAGMAIVPAAVLVPSVAPSLGWIAHIGAEGLVRSADLTVLVPGLAWRVAPPGWLPVTAYYAGMMACRALWRRERAGSARGAPRTNGMRLGSRVAAGTAVAAAVWIAWQPWTLVASRTGGRLRVTFIDVGQGDAALVQFPRGSTLLVDAGGQAATSSFDVGDRVVAPVLRWLGIRRLDAMAASHGHPDHIGGMPALVREFRPRDIWDGVPVPPLEALQRLRAQADGVGARWMNVQAGDRVRVDGVDVLIHHPPPPDWERQDVRNDDSLVLEIRWRDVSILLTGDIGREIEQAILPRLDVPPIRVLKVAHHGSLTSSGLPFLDHLRPQVAVVSAGRGNVYRHPAAEVLDRLHAVQARVLRTDLDGAVTVETDGRAIDVRTVRTRPP